MNKKRSLVITFLAACALVQGASGQNFTVSGNLVLGTPSVTLQSWQPSSADNNLDPITTPGLGINGNLDITGNLLQMGSIYASQTSQTSTGPAVALWFNQFPGNQQPVTLSLDFQVPGVQYQWRDVSGASPKTRLSLDQTNLLSLYDTSGNLGLTLGASTGIAISKPGASLTVNDLTLSGKSSLNTLYNAQGSALLSFDASGNANFANGVFASSIGFNGSSAQLNANSVAFLQSVLGNLGYQTSASALSDSTSSFGGNVGISGGAIDGAGNTLICGTISSTQTLGYYTLTPTGPNAIFVAKIDPTGSVSWAKSFGGSGSNAAAAITSDPAGNIYVACGVTTASSLLGVAVNSYGSTDACVVKLNSSGAILWAQTFGGTGYDALTSIAVDADGNVWVGGTSSSSTLNYNGSSLTNTWSATTYGIAAQLNAQTGVLSWVVPIPSGSVSTLNGVAADGQGNAFFAGTFTGTMTFAGRTLTSGNNVSNILVTKLSSSGTPIWLQTLYNTTYSSCAGIALDPAGNANIAGYFQGSIYFGNTLLVSNGTADAILAKLDQNGVPLLAVGIGGPGYDSVAHFCILPNGFTCLAGNFTGPVSVLNGAAYANVMMLDTSWNPLWSVGGVNPTSVAAAKPGNSSPQPVLLVGSEYYALRLGQEVLADNYVYRWDGSQIAATSGTASPLAWGTSIAKQSGAVALGSGAFADATNSFATSSSAAEGLNSAALGGGLATGSSSLAFGAGTVASGYGAVAIGSEDTSGGNSSFAAGFYTNAAGYASVALNSNTNAGGAEAFAAGSGTHADALLDFALGQYNVGGFTATSGQSSWVSRDPIFEIGNGSYSVHSNSMTVFKNGNLRVLGDVDVKGAMRTLPQGDLTMGPFTNQTNPNAKNPANISPTQGLRYPGE